MARPLTKCDSDGEVYVHPPSVEQNINGALDCDLAVLRARLRISDRKSPDYLKSESLVHLVREWLRCGQRQKAESALTALLTRCEANLRIKVPDGFLEDAASAREEIISQFSEMFADDLTDPAADELDFYECKFNLAFRSLRVDHVRSEKARQAPIAHLPNQYDEGAADADEDAFARVSEAFRTPATQQDTLFLKELWEAINGLPPDQRQAVILVHVLGYKEESKFPDEVTAATICKVEGRTIRNRLTRAATSLIRFKEGI